METHVLNYGPLSVCLDATTWPSYTNGTVTTCGTKVDHCVQAVGVNQDEGYWVVSRYTSTFCLASFSIVYCQLFQTLRSAIHGVLTGAWMAISGWKV